MDPRIRHGVLTLCAAGLLAAVLAARSQQPDSLPPGVTPAMVKRGKEVFLGPGLCLACHGPAGQGGIGPDLTDGVWLHHDGSYAALVRQIREGIDQQKSKGGQLMPPKGGSSVSEKDLQAVAAYVWTLSRGSGAKP